MVLLQERLHGDLYQGIDALDILVLLVVPQTGVSQVERAERISEASTEHFLELESPAEYQGQISTYGFEKEREREKKEEKPRVKKVKTSSRDICTIGKAIHFNITTLL